MEQQASTSDNDSNSLSLLLEVSRAFSASLDLERTLQTAVDRISRHLKAEGAALFMMQEDAQRLSCRVCVGPVDLNGLELEISQGIVGRSAREQTAQIIRDVRRDPDFAHFVDEQSGFETRSILCAPLIFEGRTLGVIELVNKTGDDSLFEQQDLQVLEVLTTPAALAIHNARMAQSLLQQERMQKELELAREIQENLLPQTAADDFPVHGINVSALEVSGDFYDWQTLKDGRIGFSLGDVSGKGMNAALMMAKTTSLLRAFAKDGLPPGELLARVNNEVCESSTRGMFVTCVAGIYDPGTNQVIWANAGHQPPLYEDKNGNFREEPAASPPLGILSSMHYPESSLNLDGGTYYVFTDGVTEGPDPQGIPLEVEGFTALLRQYAHLNGQTRLKALVEAMTAHSPVQHDDITLLSIKSPGSTA